MPGPIQRVCRAQKIVCQNFRRSALRSNQRVPLETVRLKVHADFPSRPIGRRGSIPDFVCPSVAVKTPAAARLAPRAGPFLFFAQVIHACKIHWNQLFMRPLINALLGVVLAVVGALCSRAPCHPSTPSIPSNALYPFSYNRVREESNIDRYWLGKGMAFLALVQIDGARGSVPYAHDSMIAVSEPTTEMTKTCRCGAGPSTRAFPFFFPLHARLSPWPRSAIGAFQESALFAPDGPTPSSHLHPFHPMRSLAPFPSNRVRVDRTLTGTVLAGRRDGLPCFGLNRWLSLESFSL